MSQQNASRVPLSRAKRHSVAVAAAILLGVGPLAAQQPAGATSAGSTNPPAAKEPTVITSERLDADYARNVFTFSGNVLAIDPQMTLRSDKMVVFFGAATNAVATVTNAIATSTNATPSVQKIIATGSVVIITPDKHRATSARAEYTASDGRVVLTENPKVETPDGTVTGEKITFWKGQGRMDVESNTRLVLTPEEKKTTVPDHGSAHNNEPTNAPLGARSTP